MHTVDRGEARHVRQRIRGGRLAAAFAVALAVTAPAKPAAGAVWTVGPGASIQDAIDAAADGDRIEVQPGTYAEDLDFAGKAVAVVGAGPGTVLRGTGAGSVVSFRSGESAASVLDSVVVRGGSAARGGGIAVVGASPTLVRNVVVGNRASQQGSGIYLESSSAIVRNNLVVYNQTSSGDPHAIEVVDGSPTLVNNTVLRNDSNGIILRGSAAAIVKNNLIGRNGSRGRGRGICDFSGGLTEISYSLFWRNRRAALLTDGIDFGSIRRAELLIGPPRVAGNVDGSPDLLLRKPPKIGSRRAEELTVGEMAAGFRPDPSGKRRRAIDAGDPGAPYLDRDGTRNDIGFTGGPESPLW